jgi:hypothetical protein
MKLPPANISVQDYAAWLAAILLKIETKQWIDLSAEELQLLRQDVERQLSDMDLPKL